MSDNVLCIKNGESDKQNCSNMQTSTDMGNLFASDPIRLQGIVSTDFQEMFRYVVDLWLCSILSYMSIAVNVIAIVVLAKMGFKETMNISLTAIAAWDIVKSVSMALMKLYGPIQLASEIFAYNWQSYTTIIFGYLYGISGYVSGAMAAFVATERCLCVSLPFTVKLLLTRKVVAVANLLISFGVIASYVVVYAQYSFRKIIHPKLNQTAILYTYSKFHYDYPLINKYTKTMSLLYPLVCFTIICFCSAITVYHLREASKSKVRSSSTTTTSHDKQPMELSARDRQVTKMLLVVVAVYIGSYIPRIGHYITLQVVPEYLPRSRYSNLLWVVTAIMFFFDMINAVANPLILFFMSSQFRNTLFGIFRWSEKK